MRRFLELPHSEQRVVLLTVLLTPVVGMVLRRRGYRGTADLLRRRTRRPVADLEEALMRSRTAAAAIRRLPGTYSCLVRSLMVWWLVGGDAVSQIQLGVAPAREGHSPRFHAWVEVDGTPINDLADVRSHYLPLTSPSPPPEDFD